MESIKERMDFIKSEWFKDHIATYEELSKNTSVLSFNKQGTNAYAVRYIFDRNYLIITGDIGDAIFCLTEKAKLKSIADEYSISYLFGKLRADRDAYDFDGEKAIEKLKSNFAEYDFDDDEEKEEFEDLAEEMYSAIREECNTESQWATILNCDYYDKIQEYDCDCWEWIYSIGKEYSWQALGWVVGLRMAYEQLKGTLKD